MSSQIDAAFLYQVCYLKHWLNFDGKNKILFHFLLVSITVFDAEIYFDLAAAKTKIVIRSFGTALMETTPS
jgi:hypothetical protein